jgi:nitrate reductase (cytochrome), electron transfer subunit
MMEKPKHQPKLQNDQKVGKVFLVFAGLCILALPLVVFTAFSYEPGETAANVVETGSGSFDENGGAIFTDYERLSREYVEGISTERTLEEYYARRQYPGSPPFITHKVQEADAAPVDCLTCHAKGGWSEELKRNTPITPHPEQVACRQCHIPMTEAELFVANDWISIAPPALGRSHLPGAPPPIPHELQMRGNCIPCHVGPGAVASIRVEHPSRGNCRQCHVPDAYAKPFKRNSES